MKKICVVIFLFFLSLTLRAEDEAPEPLIEYLEMAPKFTLNLDKPGHYLVVNVQLMVEGGDFIEKVKKHMPVLRHELIMLYSGIKSVDLQTTEQREALRLQTKKRIKETLDKYANSDGFRDVFFTEFLIN